MEEKMGTTKSTKQSESLARVIDSFVSNVEGLRGFVENIKPVAAAHDKRVVEELETLKSKIGDVIRSIPAREKETVEEERQRKPREEVAEDKVGKIVADIMDVYQQYRKLPWLTASRVQILQRSALVMLVSYFDYFLYDLIRCYYKMYPESLSDTDLSISVIELRSCADIDEAVELILNKKIEKILNEGLEKVKLFMKNYLKVELGENLIKWDVINEAIERRNISVHNDGIVNRRYLKRVRRRGMTDAEAVVKEGVRLGVSDDYFRKVSDEILVAGVILMQTCWRKWLRGHLKDADINLVSHLYGLSLRGEHDAMERMGLFAKEIKVHSPETRHEIDMYYCLAVKMKGKTSELNAELATFDEASLSPQDMLYVSALKNDLQGFYENFERPSALTGMIKEDFYSSPFFAHWSQDSNYHKRIEEAFGKESKKTTHD
jgi:hypothetical protein